MIVILWLLQEVEKTAPTNSANPKSKEKEQSRTPAEELSLRLEAPQPLLYHEQPDDEKGGEKGREIELLGIPNREGSPSLDTTESPFISPTRLGTIQDTDESREGMEKDKHSGNQRLEKENCFDPLSHSKSYLDQTASPSNNYRSLSEKASHSELEKTPPANASLTWSKNPLINSSSMDDSLNNE